MRSQPTAVYPRAEHAWLLGMAARKTEDLELVGARGLNPARTNTMVVLPARVLHGLTAA